MYKPMSKIIFLLYFWQVRQGAVTLPNIYIEANWVTVISQKYHLYTSPLLSPMSENHIVTLLVTRHTRYGHSYKYLHRSDLSNSDKIHVSPLYILPTSVYCYVCMFACLSMFTHVLIFTCIRIPPYIHTIN